MKKNMKINKSEKLIKKSEKTVVATPKKMGRPRKNPAAVITKEIEKPAKRVRKQMARKIVEKKIANKKLVKKLTKRVDKKLVANANPAKDVMKQAKKLFGEARKNVSALKKTTKMYGKLLTTALKSGDEKTIARVQKLFGYAGYSTVDGTGVSNTITSKVKFPKIKKAVSQVSSESIGEVKPKRKYVRKTSAKVEVVEAKPIEEKVEVQSKVKPAEESIEDVFGQPNISDGPSEEELADIEKELEDEDNIEDEDSDDVDGVFNDSELRDRSESDSEIYDAMRENGDID